MAATAAIYNRLHNAGLGSSVVHHTQLARSLERILEEAHLSGELILTNRKLKDFPKTGTGSKYNLADTIIADLSRNRFCELPEEVTSFAFLETLLLYHNTIRSIPESVKQLTSLTYLDLRSNQLSTLPRELCFLPLQVLLVSNNRLTALPDELGRMDRLTDLDASYNQLSALPPRIGELRSLRSLSLRSNQLMYLPRELTCLTLVSLDVSNNRIASLPLEIRQMSSLVEFNLENNPLTSPPASLCVRGLVHVFKYLEIQATKDEKGSRAGGNYDGYTTLRRAPRHNSNSNILDSTRPQRSHMDSGYNTCDGVDKRWSHDMPGTAKTKLDGSPRRTPTTPPSFSSELLHCSSLTSSSSTLADDVSTASKTLTESPKKCKLGSPQHNNYAHSNSSNGSTPDNDDEMIDQQLQLQPGSGINGVGSKSDDKTGKHLGNIQTYKEYKEALKQQRNQEISSVYKIKGQKMQQDIGEGSNAPMAMGDDVELRVNGNASANHESRMPKSIMKNGNSSSVNGHSGCNGLLNGVASVANGIDDSTAVPKKPVQKVIPSRNMEQSMKGQASTDSTKLPNLSNGDCIGYVKPSSPMKSAPHCGNGSVGGGILVNSKKLNGNGGGIISPVSNISKLSTPKTHRSVTWNNDISPEKLSFTMRREFDRQREETELMTQLRSIIETRLKMTLPEDIAAALTDGVILCHLANYVRPRSVASIHVPSPGVSKLTMARCRRNVDNFLEACRRIGVDEELICSCADVVPSEETDEDNNTVNAQSTSEQHQEQHEQESSRRMSLPNAPAVLKTVSALIAMDSNPNHQHVRAPQSQPQEHWYHHHQQKQQEQQQQQQQQKQQQQLHHHEAQTGVFYAENQNSCMPPQQQYDINDSYKHEQQLQQPTATFTKEQMMQTHIVADNSLGSSISLSERNGVTCDLADNATNCRVDNEAELLVNGHQSNDNGGYDARTDGARDCEYEFDDMVDHGYVTTNEMRIQYHRSAPQHSQQQQQHGCGAVRNLLRHAKLKSFQKIKFNLISAHGNNNTLSNHCASLATTLQTIVETESDVVGSGSVPGVYHVINEKTENGNENMSEGAEREPVNKYKLLELPKAKSIEKAQEKGSSTAAIVSKRIEFFEHSTTGSNNNYKSGSSNNSSAIVKPCKAKSNIFSIYHVPNLSITEGKLSCKDVSSSKKDQDDAMFGHDSHVLTIILSCVFIVTFLLLIFFPLPG